MTLLAGVIAYMAVMQLQTGSVRAVLVFAKVEGGHSDATDSGVAEQLPHRVDSLQEEEVQPMYSLG